MSLQQRKVLCPKCGAEMNRHARKLRSPVSPQDAELVDDDLGGILMELNSCPECGASVARDAE